MYNSSVKPSALPFRQTDIRVEYVGRIMSAVAALGARQSTGLPETLHGNRSLLRSAVPGLLVAGTIAASAIKYAGEVPFAKAQFIPIALIQAAAIGGTITAINYTNHNGSLHHGTRQNSWWESGLMSSAAMGVAGLAMSPFIAKLAHIPVSQAMLGAAVAGVGQMFLPGVALHFLNRDRQ